MYMFYVDPSSRIYTNISTNHVLNQYDHISRKIIVLYEQYFIFEMRILTGRVLKML